MANATVIKLTNNGGTTLLPISDSAYIQHRWTTGWDPASSQTVQNITSVQDALNDTIDRVDALDGMGHNPGSDNQKLSASNVETNKVKVELDGNGGNVTLAGSTGVSISYTNKVLTFSAHTDHNDLQTLSYTAGTGIQLKDDANNNVSGTVQVEGSGLITITGSSNKMIIGTSANNYSHPTNGANKTVGPKAGKTLAHGDSFDVPWVSINNLGHVTAATTYTYVLPAQYEHFSQDVPNIGLASSNQDVTNNSSTGVQEVITYVTVNGEGHVTSYGKTKIYSSDKKVSASSLSTTQLYVTGVTGTSNQQPGYDADVFLTKTAGDLSAKYFTYSTATGDKALYTDASKRIHESSVTKTELEYLSGTTSNVQTQIDNISNAISTGVTFKGTWSNGTLPETASSSTVGHMWTYVGTGTFNLPAVTGGNDAEVLRKGDAIIGVNNGTTYYWCAIDNNADIATSSIPGLVKPGTTSGKNYGVSVATDGAMTVNVPWTDNDHTSGVKAGNTKKGSNNVVSDVTIAQSTSGNHTTYTVTVSYSSITSNVTSKLQGENISGGGAYIKNFEDSTSNSKIWFKPGSNVSISYTGTSPNQYVQISATDTKYSAGAGISFDGTTINHSNSVTAQTESKARYFKYDAQGHITGSGDISTQTVVKSATFANNMKYAELKTNAEDIDETWLKAVTGLTNSVSSSSYVAVSSHSTSTCTAYVKTT